MIWWLWTAFPSSDPCFAHVIDLLEWWSAEPEDRDVAWLGEGAYDFTDNMGLGLR